MTRYRVPTSLRAAFEQDKQDAMQRRRLTVERLADLHATSPSTVYKWVEEASLPANRFVQWFHNTGGRAVIRFLAAQAGGLYLDVPKGHPAGAEDIQHLQGVLNEAVGALLTFHAGKAEKDDCLARLTHALEAMAWHRENVRKAEQPELDLEFRA